MRYLILFLLATAIPAQAKNATEAIELAAALVQPLIDGKLTVGITVGVLLDGETAIAGFGRVSRSSKKAPDGDTVYEIGSISKVFTGLLLADAVVRKLVQFEDVISEYVPSDSTVPNYEDKPIRLEHLTSHSSALPRLPPNFTTGAAKDPYAAYDRTMLYAGLAQTKLTRAPGSKYSYSNFAAGLLGQILIDLQGEKSFDDLLVARLCKPFELHDTRVTPTESMRGRLAPGYNDAGQRQPSWHFLSLAGAGGIRSTVRDMLRFAAINLDQGGLEPKSTWRRAIDLARVPRFRQAVACGWHLVPAQRTVWHNGATGGYRAMLMVDTKRKWAVIALANTTSPKVDQVARQLMSAMRGKKEVPIEVRAQVDVPADVLNSYVGRYEMAQNQVFDVTLEAGTLSVRLANQPRFPVFPASNTRFFYRAVAAEIEFTVQDGRTTKLTLFQGGRVIPAERID